MSHHTSRQFPRNCDSSQSLEIVAQAADVPHKPIKYHNRRFPIQADPQSERSAPGCLINDVVSAIDEDRFAQRLLRRKGLSSAPY